MPLFFSNNLEYVGNTLYPVSVKVNLTEVAFKTKGSSKNKCTILAKNNPRDLKVN